MLKLLGLVALYLALSTVALNALKDHATTAKPVPHVELSPDSVPNNISCQFRGEGFCQPTRFDL